MPRFRDMEQGHGSLIRAVMSQAAKQSSADRNSSGGRYSMFVAPQRGISSLVQALADRLPAETIQLSTGVRRLVRQARRILAAGNGTVAADRSPPFDAVVVATPAKAAAELVQPIDNVLSQHLSQIHHSGCCIVSLAYRRRQVAHPMDGFGFVVPAVEKREIISGQLLQRQVPGTCSGWTRADPRLHRRRVAGGAGRFAGRSAAGHCPPRVGSVARHSRANRCSTALPGSRRRCRSTMSGIGSAWRRFTQRAAAAGGLFLTGNAYHGVGIPFCIYGGEKAAQKVVDYLANGGN